MSVITEHINSFKAAYKNHFLPFMLFLLLGLLFIVIFQQPDKQIFGHDISLMGDGVPFMVEAFSEGHFPYWNPYINGGMPQMSSMNTMLFFPSSFLFILLGLTLHTFFLFQCAIAIVFLGFFMYLFVYSQGLSKLTACISGVFYIFCGSFLCYVNPGHDVMMLALVFLPAAFYFINRGFKEDRLLPYMLAGCMLGFQSLTIMYQMTFYTVICLTAFFIFKFFSEKKGIKHIFYYVVAGITTILISAVQLLQSFLYLKRSFRTGVNYEFFTSWSFHPLETIVYIYPKFFGFLESTYWGRSPFWLHNDYIGIIPLILAFAGVFFMFRNKKVLFFLAMAAGVLIMAFGGYTPLYKLLYKIPVVNGFRNPSRWLGFFAFSVVALSAFGFEYLKDYFTGGREAKDEKKMRAFLRILMIAGAVFLCVFIIFSSAQTSAVNNLKGLEQITKRFPAQSLEFIVQILYQMIKNDMLLLVIYFFMGFAIVFLTVKGKIGKVLFFLGCLLMAFLDNGVRFIAPHTFSAGGSEYTVQCIKMETIGQVDPRREEIKDFLSKDTSLFRVMPAGDFFNKNWFISDKIQSCGGYHNAPLQNYTDMQSKGFLNDFRFLSLLNVKYFLSESQINHPYLKLLNDGRVKIYENMAVFPRAILYSKNLVLDKEKMIAKMQGQSFMPLDALITNEEIKEQLDNVKNTGKEVNIKNYENNRISMEAESAGNAMLFLSEVYYPEWKAYVDGKETKIYEAFGLFRAVYLPKGKHTIEYRWDSKIFYIGAGISVLTLLIIIVCVFLRKQENTQRTQKGE